jgi:site-specific DNA recombinase
MLQKELAKRLKARYDTKTDGNGWLEVSSDGIPLCRIKYNGQFLSNADQNLSDEYRSKIADIQDEISTVREYVGLYEHAPQMKAANVSEYRQLASFGDTVLAATYSEKNGFMFCTWKQNADGDSVFWGDYSPNYEYVKEAFAVRSGLVSKDRLFSENESAYLDPASEFYITIYGSIAQSESENISANVKWGKAQSTKQGNVPFQCKHFLGYTKNADGEIEIVPEEAEIIREIYEQYLSGESLYGIKCYLEEKEIPTPAGCSVWRQETIRSILSNEKYKGDAIINKTYVSDCISKRVKANNGERNKYYIENNHPAIIDAGTFARVQEEIARRSGKPKVKQKGTKTELSRYSSRYALSELLICGECRTPYRRCTWTAKGKRKIVWRCINRLDYGKKYCHHSPSIEESLLQDAVMRAVMQTAKQNVEVLKTLKIHIGMGLTDEVTEDKTLDIQIRIAEIDAEFQKMLKAVSADNADGIDEERITELMNEKQRLTVQLEQYAAVRQKRESAKSRLDEIFTILDGLQNHPMEYDDKLVRQIIECIVVESKEKIKVVFIGGTEIEIAL